MRKQFYLDTAPMSAGEVSAIKRVLMTYYAFIFILILSNLVHAYEFIIDKKNLNALMINILLLVVVYFYLKNKDIVNYKFEQKNITLLNILYCPYTMTEAKITATNNDDLIVYYNKVNKQHRRFTFIEYQLIESQAINAGGRAKEEGVI